MWRELGQNFLKDERLAKKIVKEARVTDKDLVVEFGAGTGMLTRSLSERARKVVAVEYDPLGAARLKQRFATRNNVDVVTADALSVCPPEEPFRIVANVPYTSAPPSSTGSWTIRHGHPTSSTCWCRRSLPKSTPEPLRPR